MKAPAPSAAPSSRPPLASERRLVERAARERAERERRIAGERERLARDSALEPAAERLATALQQAAAAVAERVEVLGAELDAERQAGERLAAELRSCAGQESQVQARLKERGETVTRGEVRAQQARDRSAEAGAELTRLAEQARARGRARHRAAGRRGARRPDGPDRAAAPPPRAARPGQPARQARVRRGGRARRGARGPARGPRGRAARAGDADPRHRPPHPRGVRGDLHRRRAQLRGGRASSCSPAAAAACGSCARTPARGRCWAAATPRRVRARRGGARRGGRRGRGGRGRRGPRRASRSRSRPPASPRSGCRCSPAARSR